MVNNGTLHYDHDRDGTHTEIAGCEAKFRNKEYDTYVAIRYQDETLKVCLTYYNLQYNNVIEVFSQRIDFFCYKSKTPS